MADKKKDFYAVLGLKKECSASDLRIAYKKLAMRWHPDRCSASGTEEAKIQFQAIQEAYSVLSDANKRLLYDVGVYDSEDDEDQNGMGDFLNEMAAMMHHHKSRENGEESFEELQELFEEMFNSDIESFPSSSSSWSAPSSRCSSSSSSSFTPSSNEPNNKRDSSYMTTNTQGFNIGVGHEESRRIPRGLGERAGCNRRDGRKQRVSSCHDVSSSNNYSGSSSSFGS